MFFVIQNWLGQKYIWSVFVILLHTVGYMNQSRNQREHWFLLNKLMSSTVKCIVYTLNKHSNFLNIKNEKIFISKNNYLFKTTRYTTTSNKETCTTYIDMSLGDSNLQPHNVLLFVVRVFLNVWCHSFEVGIFRWINIHYRKQEHLKNAWRTSEEKRKEAYHM